MSSSLIKLHLTLHKGYEKSHIQTYLRFYALFKTDFLCFAMNSKPW